MFADAFIADLIRAGAPEEPDPEVLTDLVTRYKWDPSLRDQIVLQLIFPVYYLARRFRNKNNADDVLSEAILALVECVDRWCEVAENEDIRRYVEFSVRKRMKDFIDNDAVLKMPSRRVREKLAKGEEFVNPTVATLFTHDSPDPGGLAPIGWQPTVPEDKTFDIQEFFRSRADSRDQVIVEMRINGCSAIEIAEAVGQKRSWVYKRLRDLEQAFAQVGEEAA